MIPEDRDIFPRATINPCAGGRAGAWGHFTSQTAEALKSRLPRIPRALDKSIRGRAARSKDLQDRAEAAVEIHDAVSRLQEIAQYMACAPVAVQAWKVRGMGQPSGIATVRVDGLWSFHFNGADGSTATIPAGRLEGALPGFANLAFMALTDPERYLQHVETLKAKGAKV